MRNYSITNIVWRRIIVCLMAAMLLLTFAACGSEPVQQAAPTGAGEGAAEEQLRQQLSNGDVTEITIQGTLYLSAPAEVVGSKTITGDGKIVARGSWDEDYLITVASGNANFGVYLLSRMISAMGVLPGFGAQDYCWDEENY